MLVIAPETLVTCRVVGFWPATRVRGNCGPGACKSNYGNKVRRCWICLR